MLPWTVPAPRPDSPLHILQALSAYLSATPTIKFWTMAYTVGIQQSWLDVDIAELGLSSSNILSFNDKPLFIAQLRNTFTLKKGWQLEMNGEYHSPGYTPLPGPLGSRAEDFAERRFAGPPPRRQ